MTPVYTSSELRRAPDRATAAIGKVTNHTIAHNDEHIYTVQIVSPYSGHPISITTVRGPRYIQLGTEVTIERSGRSLWHIVDVTDDQYTAIGLITAHKTVQDGSWEYTVRLAYPPRRSNTLIDVFGPTHIVRNMRVTVMRVDHEQWEIIHTHGSHLTYRGTVMSSGPPYTVSVNGLPVNIEGVLGPRYKPTPNTRQVNISHRHEHEPSNAFDHSRELDFIDIPLAVKEIEAGDQVIISRVDLTNWGIVTAL